MEPKDLTVDEQIQAGIPVSGAIDAEHSAFLKTLQGLITSGKIDPNDPQTFLNKTVYEKLDESTKEHADLTLVNMANQVRLIHQFIESSQTPDESPQLQTMVEQLWQMKQVIEKDHDVFIF